MFALHMSAFEGKADMTVCGNPLSRSLLGAKRTSHFASQMSAFDPKRTWEAAVMPIAMHDGIRQTFLFIHFQEDICATQAKKNKNDNLLSIPHIRLL